MNFVVYNLYTQLLPIVIWHLVFCNRTNFLITWYSKPLN